MIILFKVLSSLLTSYLLFKLLKLKLDFNYIIYTVLTSILFIYLESVILMIAYVILTYMFMKYVFDEDDIDVLLYSLFSITVYIISDLIKKSLFIWVYPFYSNYYEIIVIQFLLTLFMLKVIVPKTNYLDKRVLINLSLSIFSLILIIVCFTKLSMKEPLLQHEVILGSCSVIFLSYFILKDYVFISDTANEIKIYQKKLDDKRYSSYNHAKVISTYEKSNKLNHNVKYVLLNLKRLLNSQEYEQASEYLDHNLKIVQDNQTVFTDNPFFDYVINCFDEELKKKGISCNKNIFIPDNCDYNDSMYTDEIDAYFKDMLKYLDRLQPKSVGLIAQEKGDYFLLKCIFDNIKNNYDEIKYQYKLIDNTIIVTLIIEKEIL